MSLDTSLPPYVSRLRLSSAYEAILGVLAWEFRGYTAPQQAPLSAGVHFPGRGNQSEANHFFEPSNGHQMGFCNDSDLRIFCCV